MSHLFESRHLPISLLKSGLLGKLFYIWWAGLLSRYSDWLRAGRSGDRIPVGARFSAPVQTGPGTHPASCTMGTGCYGCAFCAFFASLQGSTECTSITVHSSQHNITQHGMLPQYPTSTTKLIYDWF